jgi:hypothetical protein
MKTENIGKTLSIAGIDLEFSAGFTIKGIPGFSTSILYKGEPTLYIVEQQNFTFQISTLDAVNNSIVNDMLFTMQDNSYIYTFKLDRPPISDLTGWSKMQVNFISKSIL